MEIQSSNPAPMKLPPHVHTNTTVAAPCSLLREEKFVFFFAKRTREFLFGTADILHKITRECVRRRRKRERSCGVCVKLSIYTNKLVGAYFFSHHHVVPALLLCVVCWLALVSILRFWVLFSNFFFASSFSLRSEVLQMQ